MKRHERGLFGRTIGSVAGGGQPPVGVIVMVRLVRQWVARRSARWVVLPALSLPLSAGAVSQGPVADGPYVGTLPCADCSGIHTTLTLYTMGEGGVPLVYRMSATYLGTAEGDRTEERLGPWARLGAGADALVRVEPYSDERRKSFRREGADRLVLLDRHERPIDTQQNLALERDASSPAARLSAPRTLFRGTLVREAGALVLRPCSGGNGMGVRDVSPASVITAAITDLGFDRHGRTHLEAWGTLRNGELLIDRLNRAGPGLECAQGAVGFRAQGGTPAWSLESGRNGVRLEQADGDVFTTPLLPLSWRWPGGRPDRAEAALDATTESGTLRARLLPKVCRDTAAAAVYGFTARVTIVRPAQVTEVEGCAYLGNEPLF